MVIGRGVMQTGKFTMYNTTSSFTSIIPTSGTANCGDLLTFNIKVENTIPNGPVPTGTVNLIDTLTSNIISTTTLSNGIAIFEVSINNNINNLAIYYPGLLNIFKSSQSINIIYNTNAINTVTTMITAPGDFCYAQIFTVEARVAAVIGSVIPSGIVRFTLYFNENDSIDLSPAILDSAGIATTVIPPFITTPGTEYNLQAIYEGDICFNGSASAEDREGALIRAFFDRDITSTAVSIVDSIIFCLHDKITLFSNTSATNFIPPFTGRVFFNARKGESELELGSSEIINGISSINVLGNTFSIGSWSISAHYVDNDGYCYNDSTSPDLIVHVTDC